MGEFEDVIKAVGKRWLNEFEKWGVTISDQRFKTALDKVEDDQAKLNVFK